LNVICHNETNHDDDNSYVPGFEQTNYMNYKRGATAAMQLLRPYVDKKASKTNR